MSPPGAGRRRLVLVQELDAGRETQRTAEWEEPRAVRALQAGQEGHAVVETSVTRHMRARHALLDRYSERSRY
ncbi:hypothetical protein ACFRAO_16135 [Streptomyces sp. NPDC056656]|uniref:hypothetical protein n=1 Tax=Streptomyces sp. NPDC056656 TaxID=3345895 RepID=UPI0036D063A2